MTLYDLSEVCELMVQLVAHTQVHRNQTCITFGKAMNEPAKE